MAATMARTVRFHETGDASVLRIEELPLEAPGENEIRIRVEALGLNRAEVAFRYGAYLEAPEFPARLGYEAAGTVDALGAGVEGFNIGDKVGTIPAFSMNQYGVYGEYATVPAHAVAKSPVGFDARQSASIWMQYLTAWGAMVPLGNLEAGQHFLVTAASSSVGVAAIQLGKSLGAEVIATTRGPEKVQFLLEQGADHVVQTDTEGLPGRVADITAGKGVELVFDPIGGPMLQQLAEAAAHGGMIVEYGALSPEPTPYPLFASLAKALTIRGYTLFEISSDSAKLQPAVEMLRERLEKGELVPIIDRAFPFDDIQDAHRYMESNQQMGKIVVDV
jgi:NADPH:quinone reductase-like Zn-dependent oxidoreductase